MIILEFVLWAIVLINVLITTLFLLKVPIIKRVENTPKSRIWFVIGTVASFTIAVIVSFVF